MPVGAPLFSLSASLAFSRLLTPSHAFAHRGCPCDHTLSQLTDNNDPDWYNRSENYQEAVRDVLTTKKRVIHMLALGSTWEDEEEAPAGAPMVADSPRKNALPKATNDAINPAELPAAVGEVATDAAQSVVGLLSSATQPFSVIGNVDGTRILDSADVGTMHDEDMRRALVARRQFACAGLAAREGAHEDASNLLNLCVGGRPLPPQHSSDIDDALASPIVIEAARDALGAAASADGLPATPRAIHMVTTKYIASESWRLSAARLLLEEGVMDPWPGTFVLIATGGGPIILAACAAMAVQLLKVAKREPGVSVLVYEDGEERWKRGIIEKVIDASPANAKGPAEGRAKRGDDLLAGPLARGGHSPALAVTVHHYEVSVGIDVVVAPPSRVLVPSSGGISALLREAAGADSVDLVRAFLVLGVGIFEVDMSGTTALHAAAAGGQLQTCKLLIDAGIDPLLDNARQESPWEQVRTLPKSLHVSSNLTRSPTSLGFPRPYTHRATRAASSSIRWRPTGTSTGASHSFNRSPSR